MIATALTEMFGLKHPIVLGPMGMIKSVAGAAALVAQISAEAETQLRAGAKLMRWMLEIPVGTARPRYPLCALDEAH